MCKKYFVQFFHIRNWHMYKWGILVVNSRKLSPSKNDVNINLLMLFRIIKRAMKFVIMTIKKLFDFINI